MILILKFVLLFTIGQSLYFKFTSHQQSVKLFSVLRIEPWGRWLIGITELIGLCLLFVPALSWIGSVIILFMMAGAIVSHVFFISLKFDGDYLLFTYAVISFFFSFWIFKSTFKLV